MPASAACNRPELLTGRIAAGALSLAGAGAAEAEALLKALRELKNQIIGNKTKKIAYVHLGAVPSIVAALSAAADAAASAPSAAAPLIVQCAAALGSFACGVDTGVRAVIDAGAVPCLTGMLTYPDEKVVDASARSLRIIFQSKLAPKYDFLQEKNMRFLLSLLNSINENVTELAASIITHSCETRKEQKALCDAGVPQRLVDLLEGSLNQRDACLDSIAAIVKDNPEVVSQFIGIGNGKSLKSISELINDRNPRTRFLACVCSMVIGNASSSYIQGLEIQTKLILILLELLEEPGRVGDQAPFVLMDLIKDRLELHKQAHSVGAVEKISKFLLKNPIETRRLQGIILTLAQLCSQLEKCRCQLLSLQVLNNLIEALKHDSLDVRIAACTCLKSISRSVKTLGAGHFARESLIVSLLQLLQEDSASVQVEALGVLCNIVITFNSKSHVFTKLGVLKELVRLSKSMDSTVRLNAVWALRNMAFLADKISQEEILMELTESTLVSLINDPEISVQEQALALICNLAGGSSDSIDRLVEGNAILDAITRQMHCSSAPKVCTQVMLLLNNIATGNELHKDVVLSTLLPKQHDGCFKSFIIKFLQSDDSCLKRATTWLIINLTNPESPNTASVRASRLCDAGVVSQLKCMVDDPVLDVKYRIKTALQQFTLLGLLDA